MIEPSNRDPRSAGALLALCVLGGVVIGLVWRQPTIGLLGGTMVGAVIAVLVWLFDRRRAP